MGLFCELWDRPGSATPGRKIDEPPTTSFSFHDGVAVTGDGRMVIPDSFPSFDEILFRSAGAPASTVTSMVRVFNDSTSPPKWVFDWLPKSMLPVTAKTDFNVDVGGEGIKSIVGYARTEAWDWDGSPDWTPTFPDWIYGGRNLLSNPGFEDATFTPRTYILVIDASAGTFTLSDGTDTTSAIAYNVSDGPLEAEIESDIAAIDDISVSPLGGQPLAYQLRITAGGGTFVISGPSDSTGNLAFNIGAAALETAIEGLTGVTDVTVTAVTLDGEPGFVIDLVNPATVALSIDTTNLTDGSATLTTSNTGNGFELQLVTPPLGVNLTVDDSGLTGTAALVLTEAGNADPSSWTRSQQVSTGTPRDFGVYVSFERSDVQAHSGTYSLFIDPGPVNSRIEAFAGAQQVQNTEIGGLYQKAVWVFPTAAGQTYRLVARGVDEDIMSRADGSQARTDVTPPANVWTRVEVTDVVASDTRIIWRFANTQLSGNPAGFFIDDAEFNEGMAPASVGKILTDLYLDATSDHVADGRLVWEDEANPGIPYLTLDFDADVDSAGQPWDSFARTIRIFQRFTYLQVMEQMIRTWGYEWRIVPDSIEDGTYLWQVYNPGTMMTDYTAAASPAIQGGSEDTRRSLQRFAPDGSDFLVESAGRATARATSTALEGAIGRIESSRIDREAPTIDAASDAASSDLAAAIANGQQFGYTLTDPTEPPGVAYILGDLLTIHDPPEADTAARLADLEVTVTPVRVDYETTWVES